MTNDNAETVVESVDSRGVSVDYQPRVLAVGTTDDQGIQLALQTISDGWEFRQQESIDTSVRLDVDLIVLLVDRSGRFPDDFVARLSNANSETPLVALLSSHCEGGGRSARPWPGVTRIYWHKWQFEFAKFCYQMGTSQTSDLHLPTALSPTERRLKELGFKNQPPRTVAGLLAGNTVDREAYADLLETASSEVMELTTDCMNVDRADFLLLDSDSLDEELEQAIEQCRAQFPVGPILLVLGFPRPHEVKKAQEIGVTRVLSKPLLNCELAWAISEFVVDQSCR